MSIAQLEVVLKKSRAPYEKNGDGTLVIKAESRIAIYPILFSEEQHGWLQAQVWFSPTEQLIDDVRGLGEHLKRWIGNVQVGFHGNTGRFYAGSFVRPETFWPEVRAFVTACDSLAPLFQRAGELGKWDPQLVDLAFTPLEEFMRPN